MLHFFSLGAVLCILQSIITCFIEYCKRLFLHLHTARILHIRSICAWIGPSRPLVASHAPRKASRGAVKGGMPANRAEVERSTAEETPAKSPVRVPAHLREMTLPVRKPAKKTMSKNRKSPRKCGKA